MHGQGMYYQLSLVHRAGEMGKTFIFPLQQPPYSWNSIDHKVSEIKSNFPKEWSSLLWTFISDTMLPCFNVFYSTDQARKLRRISWEIEMSANHIPKSVVNQPMYMLLLCVMYVRVCYSWFLRCIYFASQWTETESESIN